MCTVTCPKGKLKFEILFFSFFLKLLIEKKNIFFEENFNFFFNNEVILPE
jgi:hypothetical protein